MWLLTDQEAEDHGEEADDPEDDPEDDPSAEEEAEELDGGAALDHEEAALVW